MTELTFDEAAVRATLEAETMPLIKARIAEMNEHLNVLNQDRGDRAGGGQGPLPRLPTSGPKSRLIDALVASYKEHNIDTEAATLEPEQEYVEEVPAEDPPEPAESTEPSSDAEEGRVEPGVSLVPLKPPENVMPTQQEYAAMRAIANEVCRTEFVPSSFRGRPEAVLAAILTGRELGIGPMQSLKDISIIDGKPALSASLMMALMRKGGVVVLESESTMDRAFIRARRTDTGEIMAVEWTYEAARTITYHTKNGPKLLVDKDNWVNYRQDMLWARCVGRLGRRLAPDILGGMGYSAEEMADFEGGWEDSPYETRPAESAGPISAGPISADGWQAPSGWKDMHERFTIVLGDVNEMSAAEATEWMKLALHACWSKLSIGELTTDEQKEAWVYFKHALKELEAFEGELVFTPNARDLIANAFREFGTLIGPPWRIGPDETSLPTYWEANGVTPPKGPSNEPSAEPDGSAEDGDWTPLEREFTKQEQQIRAAAWAGYVMENAGQELPDEPPNEWDPGTEWIPF